MKTLTLRALERSVRIDCAESETQALLTATYGHMKNGPGAADLHYTVGGNGAGAFVIKRPGCEPLTAPDDGTFLALFDGDIAVELQKLRRDLYFVHAAVLTVADVAFMLVGKSGGGKSTLCWALSHHGFPYLSDELGPVDLETLGVHRYTRALTLKTRPPASAYPIPSSALRSTRGWHIAAEDVPGGIGKAMTRLAAIFFLQRDAAAREPSIRPMRAAEATARLYAGTLNALAHAGDGLDAAIRITGAVTSFELVTASLGATCELLTATLNELLPSP